ncbi:MAG: hypothetical protein WAM60_21920 [Candidatus Promineifilaceae bacterium]
MSPEEATARAQEGVFRPSDNGGGSAAGAEYAVGDSANVVGSGFLINLLDVPGGRIAGSQSRGSTVEILESTEYEGTIWYHVDSETGDGWLKAENLEPAETEAVEESAPTGPGTGDTVYLVSNGFLINLLDEPNGRLIAVQERGVAVTIEDVFTADDGSTWYLINAPTGEGWIPTDNISEEAP